VQAFAEDHRERITVEDHSAGAVEIRWTEQRINPKVLIGVLKLVVESKGCNPTLFE
jgi:hypothetical protein